MDLCFDFVDPTRQIAVLFFTSSMLVNNCSDFLALGFLTVFWDIGKTGLSSVIYSVVKIIAASIVSLNLCCSSHLPAY